ncbi:c-type cytochrome [Rubellicoccus peritrichatus]|uniref:C-type cytochrome n=1 Tax=Rubellicoccus peritrichatus TaxID=3080537 RepID=A0AAQ3LA80_9BACT|nr:c-type cytochrome [Puniceicoccus sp. CR14]WOO41681.1 c-type cytochrome [Puniceicoccus sp. CR14]
MINPMRLPQITLFSLIVLILSGCDWMPGKPKRADEYIRPENITDFATLYNTNCASCHSLDSKTLAAARPLNDPVYVAFAGKDMIKKITSEGVDGTTMPAALDSKGGNLTEKQIDIIVDGIIKSAGRLPDEKAKIPPYSAPLGDAKAGLKVYTEFCASCHGKDGNGGTLAGSIINSDYLALVSDQTLRTTIVAGRTDLGMPDWQRLHQSKHMSNSDIADVVAWIASHRTETNLQLEQEAATGDKP